MFKKTKVDPKAGAVESEAVAAPSQDVPVEPSPEPIPEPAPEPVPEAPVEQPEEAPIPKQDDGGLGQGYQTQRNA